MPALSPTMTQGNIGPWKKKIGDQVSAGDVLVEIETDKAQMEFECQEEGFLAKILLPEGAKEAQVGQPLAILASKKDDVSKFDDYKASTAPKAATESSSGSPEHSTATASSTTPSASTTTSAPSATTTPSASSTTASAADAAPGRTPSIQFSHGPDRVFASPLAKATARAMNLNLGTITGSGPHGRVIRADVVAAGSTAATGIPAGAAFVDEPVSTMRKVIAERLTLSKQSIPHYYLTTEIVMDRLLAIREQLNKRGAGKYKLSVNDFIIKAAALAMASVPAVNSAWQGTTIRRYRHADISVAVATESGLITPIVTRAETKGLVAISEEMRELASKARENKLRPEQFQGGSFTISNLGMYGVKHFTAIINPPQACILAVGATERRLLPDPEGEATLGSVMTVTMSCDHRVVDGATGATWLQHFKSYLEEPATMVL